MNLGYWMPTVLAATDDVNGVSGLTWEQCVDFAALMWGLDLNN